MCCKCVAFLIFIAVDLLVNCQQQSQYIRPCYFTNWSQYRPGVGRFVPEDYETGLCSHILFAFVSMNQDFTLKVFDAADLPSAWEPRGMYFRVNALKKDDPKLKTLLSIGGANLETRLFKEMSKTGGRRKVFIDSVVDFVRKYDFDGFDIDWEYPRGAADKLQFSKLLRETRAAFEYEAASSGRERLLLTAAVSPGEGRILRAYDIPAIAPSVDYILLMTYDFHGPWNNETGFNSPIYKRRDLIFWKQVWNTDWAANYWHKKGMPKEKIIIGVATYGRGWTLANSRNHGLGTLTTGAAKKTPFAREAGLGAYYELCAMASQPAARKVWQKEQQGLYFYIGDQWWSYDDERSVRNKMGWLKTKGYGGAFVWTLDYDDFTGSCPGGRGKKYPLISAIKEELTSQPSEKPTVSPTPTTALAVTTTAPPVGQCEKQADGSYAQSDSCQRFLLCSRGRNFTMLCPPNFRFIPAKGYCMKMSSDDCVAQKQKREIRVTFKKHQPIPHAVTSAESRSVTANRKLAFTFYTAVVTYVSLFSHI